MRKIARAKIWVVASLMKNTFPLVLLCIYTDLEEYDMGQHASSHLQKTK